MSNSSNNHKKVQYAFYKSDFIIIPNGGRVISELNLSELKVYLTLAKHSDQDGVSYPSKQRIAQLTRLTPRAVQKAIASLRSKGLIFVEEQRTKDGRQTTNRYTIVAEGRTPLLGRENTETPPEGEHLCSHEGEHAFSQNSTSKELNQYELNHRDIDHSPPASDHSRLEDDVNFESLPEKLQELAREKRWDEFATAAGCVPEVLFAAFWEFYPRKVAKKKARQIFLRLFKKHKERAALFKRVMEGLERHKQSRQWSDHSYIPHPTTWLSQERWEDEVIQTKRIVI